MSGFRRYLLVVGAFFALAVLVQWHPWSSGGTDATVSRSDENGAKIVCQDFVKERLRAPATANFASYGSQTATRRGDGTFAVHGWVDAQNGFGANIRTTYDCAVLPSSSGDWKLVSLTTSP